MGTSRLSSFVVGTMLLGVTAYASGCAVLIGGAAAGGAAGTVVSAKDSRHEQHAPMAYVGTVLANVVYVPAKAVFAGAGAATSGVTYLVTLGNTNTSRQVWNASVGGNYVVTPSMVEGHDHIHFVG
jgi:hypothetical protein